MTIYICATYVHPKAFYLLPLIVVLVLFANNRIIKSIVFIYVAWHAIEYIPFASHISQNCENVPGRQAILNNMNINPTLFVSDPVEFFRQIAGNFSSSRLDLFAGRILLSDQYEHAMAEFWKKVKDARNPSSKLMNVELFGIA